MIRVNLLRDAGGGGIARGGGGGGGGSGVALDGSTAAPRESAGGNVDLVVKVVLVAIPVALIWGYRSYQIGVKSEQKQNLEMQVNRLNEKLKAFEPGLKDIEKFQEEKRKLDNQLDVIKRLSKERLKNVKSMEALQNIIPLKAWLTSLKINENRVELEGMATDDLVISDFMKDLEASIYFANVTLDSSEEVKREEGAVKQFRIKCNLENL